MTTIESFEKHEPKTRKPKNVVAKGRRLRKSLSTKTKPMFKSRTQVSLIEKLNE